MFVTNSKDTQAMDKCRKQAQANANVSGVAWMIFQDTNSNYHVEVHNTQQQGIIAIMTPENGTT